MRQGKSGRWRGGAGACSGPQPAGGRIDPTGETAATVLCVDAGVGHIRLRATDARGEARLESTVPSGSDLAAAFASPALERGLDRAPEATTFLTGKLAPLVRRILGGGKTILPAAAAWLAARDLMRREEDGRVQALAIIDLSASGYLLVGVDRDGQLKDDLLLVNPRCGAGSGINLDRVLQKLGLTRADVDPLLAAYAGEPGRALREETPVRADRCGVFSSSATISDKNQGIPIEVALATTLKSEVLKACRKLPTDFDKVCLTGRVFHWRFARECAEDVLRAQGVGEIVCDPDNTQVLDSLRGFAETRGDSPIPTPNERLLRTPALESYPSLQRLRHELEAAQHFVRLPDPLLPRGSPPGDRPVFVALDVGSTMAKAVLADADSGEIRWLRTYNNAGDTIATVKRVFRELLEAGAGTLPVRGVGITGSGRYQVREALEHIYPELLGRVFVLVENYAHARGSLTLARRHVNRLKAAGVKGVDEDFCILVDIGGEDTKISTIALKEAELYGNAMNLKCSAGTGSLMDTLTAMFDMSDVGAACREAYLAPRGWAINATCAVFLMENARRLQMEGVARGEILASANWAIVENMARTLWSQLELPPRAVVLLHGQTMCSDPLPVAVTHRLQTYLDAPAYALVPPHPGHRACFGLVHTLKQTAPAGEVPTVLGRFLDALFEKRIVQCHGAACEDKSACCNRSLLTCRGGDGRKLVSFTLGGCSAINELLAKKKDDTAPPVRDTYKEIWDFVDRHQPRSDDPRRLIIPRSFAVSEWAYLLARLFENLGVPVHVDDVRESDVREAQPLFNVDACAPQMGAVGQFRRLAGEPHGLVLAPQIEFLPTDRTSLGRTCTLNQGGVAVAMNLARIAHPEARFFLFNVDLSSLDAEALRLQLQERLQPVFRHYGLLPSRGTLREAIAGAILDHHRLRTETADLAASCAEEALAAGIPVALALGREYILNPGIFDSHVRRLLRDKHMVVLPSYVLDLDLNENYGHIYWRNPHFMVSLLDAVARRQLHERLRHARLRELFRRIETGTALLPVVQVSTFSCGPDSVTLPLIAEIMKQRPFLLIQSDAVIRELAHLENRINTYVKQLELGPTGPRPGGGKRPFEIRTLEELVNTGPIDRGRDVIYLPTLGDNRAITAALRGAGYTCIDNYGEDFDLQRLVRQGRRSAGDAVCAPLAAVYGDLERAVADFNRRRAAGDPQLRGKSRLLYFDNAGSGPCRQGQYADVHRLLAYKNRLAVAAGEESGEPPCPVVPGAGLLRFLIGRESQGYEVGVEEWALVRAQQGAVLHGVLQSLLFTGGARCRDEDEYQRFLADFRALKESLYRAQESFHGPGPLSRALLHRLGDAPYLAPLIKYFAYGITGRELVEPLRRFTATWLAGREPASPRFTIALTGEAYMRAAQAEDIFRILLAYLGFRRFALEYTPVWSYLEFLLEVVVEMECEPLERLKSADKKEGAHAARRRIRATRILQLILRHLVARPLYAAAGLPLPLPVRRVLGLTRELIPTLRPSGEIITYVGEAIGELRRGADLVLNVAPNGCMVSTMGEVLTPAIIRAAGRGRVQHLFSADGDVDEELLALALLKAMGPDGLDPVRAATEPEPAKGRGVG